MKGDRILRFWGAWRRNFIGGFGFPSKCTIVNIFIGSRSTAGKPGAFIKSNDFAEDVDEWVNSFCVGKTLTSRAILKLYYENGRHPTKISEILNLDVKTVRKVVKEARKEVIRYFK